MAGPFTKRRTFRRPGTESYGDGVSAGPACGVAVGTFVKSTGAAPVSQQITGLGFTPKAVIFWTFGGTADGVIKTKANGDARGSFGYATGIGQINQYVSAVVADS